MTAGVLLRPADPCGPALRPLVERHLADMLAASPPGSSHALEPAALAGPGVRFLALWEGERVVGFGAIVRLTAGGSQVRTLHDSRSQASWDDHFAFDYWGTAV